MAGLIEARTAHRPHFTHVSSLSPERLAQILDLAEALRGDPMRHVEALRGRSIACIFEKPSTRTRVSFAAAAATLGATPISLSSGELQIGRGESIADTARSLSGYVSAIAIRTFGQGIVEELAHYATVPVVNALSDTHHPCQALADLLTIREMYGGLSGLRLAFVGNGHDNVAHSLLEAGALTGMHVTIGCPRSYPPDTQVLHDAQRIAAGTGAELTVVHAARDAIARADVVYADVWASMGEDDERRERIHHLRSFEVTEELMALAARDAIFMHCLPAHRGLEVAAPVIDGPRSAVWRQSANRLPTEAALLLTLIRSAGT